MAQRNPNNSTDTGPRQGLIPAVLGLLLVGLFVVFPPFHVVSLADSGAAQAGGFNAHAFVAKFWEQKLLPNIQQATAAHDLEAALAANPKDAVKQYARSVGIGGTKYFFVAGEGIVTAADDDGVAVAVGGAAKASYVLESGLVFGNAVRDGTGLLDVNGFGNSEDFNAVASELNAVVENVVMPAVRRLGTVGATLSFAGIAETSDSGDNPRPVRLIPIHVELKP